MMVKKMFQYIFVLVLILFLCAPFHSFAQPLPQYNLVFDSLAKRWDEGIPLGNGWLGALIWKKNNKVRISLDRADLWDDRPMPRIDKLRFSWIVSQVYKNDYDTVHQLGDVPYDKFAAPTKIPGAAIEFDMAKLGKVVSNRLDIKSGWSNIKFDNGIVFNNYVHATKQIGYFGFENITIEISPELILPEYIPTNKKKQGPYALSRLGYMKGTVTKTKNSILYHQPTWNGNYYEVLMKWVKFPGNKIIGEWTISNNQHASLPEINTKSEEPTGWDEHIAWWNDYWQRSSVQLPDSIIGKQYYLEMYKFGSVTRSNTPPITLQAIWTADDGNLPPWKGDFHHDLNTQLSYWPGYTGNHLDLTSSYTNWQWKIKEENKRWTKACFETDGLNIPGVTTISGKPMGGWIQYSVSPTTAAWIAEHFYWQWKYSMDKDFLEEKCKPWFKEVETYISAILQKGKNKNSLPLSSSPEYFDNTIKAWFKVFTNYDLALIRNFYRKAMEVNSENERYTYGLMLKQNALPELDTNETGLTVAPGQNLDVSHRHFSPYMAIYPLCLLDMDNGADKSIIQKSLRRIEEKGTSQWCGYSFSWMASIYARAKEAEKAVKQLQIFATNFCSPNSFHLNGDQKGGQYSSFTYRPFTLEGNFAFAQGVHELLIQTNWHRQVEIFPSIPDEWKDVSFENLRVEGAFLVSAKRENGLVIEIKVKSEQGGIVMIRLPKQFSHLDEVQAKYKPQNGIVMLEMKKGETIVL